MIKLLILIAVIGSAFASPEEEGDSYRGRVKHPKGGIEGMMMSEVQQRSAPDSQAKGSTKVKPPKDSPKDTNSKTEEKEIDLKCSSDDPIYCWTDWFLSTNTSRRGTKNLSRLQKKYPDKICPEPIDIEAKTLDGQTPQEAGDVIKLTRNRKGFTCRDKDQPDKVCEDYKVRFSCSPPFCASKVCWTKWYNRDNPDGSGDSETLKKISHENPGEICKHPLYMDVVTVKKSTPAEETGDKFYILNPSKGFVCRNKDQRRHRKCNDYKVRFGCPCEEK